MDVVFDYGYDGIMRAFEQSQLRLGRTSWDVAIIHDLDRGYHGEDWDRHFRDLAEGGLRALDELRSTGAIGAIGAGINERGMMTRFLDLFDIDVFLVAMLYTLLHQEVLDDELPRAHERGVGIVIGAPLQSGILATGPTPEAKYNYGPVPPAIAARVARIEAVCRRHGVPLAAAALQFPLGHPAVASVIPGPIGAAQVQRNLESFAAPIPADLWVDLKADGLVHPDAPVPA
jgi:D-threo-aldose 1-dehydrogenase